MYKKERVFKALTDSVPLFFPKYHVLKILKVSKINCTCMTVDSFQPLKTYLVYNYTE